MQLRRPDDTRKRHVGMFKGNVSEKSKGENLIMATGITFLIFALSGIVVSILIFVVILRWVLRLDEIVNHLSDVVSCLKNIDMTAIVAKQHLDRIDFFAEQEHNRTQQNKNIK